jgi:hypothetical protein
MPVVCEKAAGEDEILNRPYADHAQSLACGIEDAIVAHQRAGMRSGDRGSERTLPDLEYNNGLAAGKRARRCLAQPLRIPDRFEIDADNPRFRMIEKIVDEVGKADHGFVAGGRDETQADMMPISYVE